MGDGACKSITISHNTEWVVGAFTTEGFHAFNAMTGERIYKKSFEERCFYVDLNLGDTELCVVLISFKGVHYVNTYDFWAIVSKQKDLWAKN